VYAVVRTGGRQYRVSEGDVLDVEKLDQAEGSQVELDDVLMAVDGEDVRIGTPAVDGAKVVARVLSQVKDNKIVVYKYKKRKRYRRKQGHRQKLTRIKIESIQI
jgi:large subunit ribosomal protein L21